MNSFSLPVEHLADIMQGVAVLGCVVFCGYLTVRLNVLSRSISVICDVSNVHTHNAIVLEDRIELIEARVTEHAKMLAHMARMRAAKAAKKATTLKVRKAG
jgi:hypothetical protein